MLHEDRYGILKSYSTIAGAIGNIDKGSEESGKKQHNTALLETTEQQTIRTL